VVSSTPSRRRVTLSVTDVSLNWNSTSEWKSKNRWRRIVSAPLLRRSAKRNVMIPLDAEGRSKSVEKPPCDAQSLRNLERPEVSFAHPPPHLGLAPMVEVLGAVL
jgi:hypothetical protein